MTDAYEILGVTPGADDAQIRSRYLDLVREFPPDRAPERFAQVRAAFEDLREPLRRLERQMFSLAGKESLAAIEADLRARLRSARLPVDALLGLADTK
jgi:curved DNA-binding protein CbpA